MRFDFKRVPGCVEWWCLISPGGWHGAGADIVKVVERGSVFLMSVGLAGRVFLFISTFPILYHKV